MHARNCPCTPVTRQRRTALVRNPEVAYAGKRTRKISSPTHPLRLFKFTYCNTWFPKHQAPPVWTN
jgi:hypothetical protein